MGVEKEVRGNHFLIRAHLNKEIVVLSTTEGFDLKLSTTRFLKVPPLRERSPRIIKTHTIDKHSVQTVVAMDRPSAPTESRGTDYKTPADFQGRCSRQAPLGREGVGCLYDLCLLNGLVTQARSPEIRGQSLAEALLRRSFTATRCS